MTTQEIDKNIALKMSKGWEVVSASDVKYFITRIDWKKMVVKAKKVDDKKKIIFTLYNSDFVEVEKQ